MTLVHRDDATVGFRPEKMLRAPVLHGATDGHAVVNLEVHRIEHLSGDRHLRGTLTGLGDPTRSSWTGRARPSASAAGTGGGQGHRRRRGEGPLRPG